MVYANDEWVQVPVMQLYDTGLMQSAINNARYMYEKAEKRMDDFYDKYGEFMSPFQKDMDRYNQIVGNIKSVVDNLYATGEDPLRTASGRAKMAAALRSVNPAEFAAMKSNAKMGYAYLDAAQKLRSQGKYSEAQELFDIMQNHGKTMGEFATLDPLTGRFNTWDRSAPIEATTLRDLTFDSYKGRTARALTEEDFKDPRLASYKYDKNYDWTGYLYSDLLKNAPGASLALAGDPRAAFFRDQARQMVIARGEEPTAAAVEKQFQKNIADANTWALIDPAKKANEFALDDYRTRNDIRAHAANKATDYYYDILPYADENGDGKLSKEERAAFAKAGGKGRKNNKTYNIFREAEERPGFDVPFANGAELSNYIAPVSNKISLIKDKDSGLYVYQIPGDMIDKVLYTEYSSRGNNNSKLYRYVKHGGEDFDKESNYYLIYNTGGLRHKKVGGKDRYFIGGQLMKKGQDGRYSYEGSGPITYEMEVKETDHVYGKKKEE